MKCKRCKVNENEKGSMNCKKCMERNERVTNLIIAENVAKNLHISDVIKSLPNSEPLLAERDNAENYNRFEYLRSYQAMFYNG